MAADAFVREGRPDDAGAIAEIQTEAWRRVYGAALPAEVLDELTGAAAAERFAAHWRGSMDNPPTARHRLLVAVQPEDAADGRTGRVTGFASVGPAGDDDRWPRTDAEIYAFHVAPDRTRQGHGSRLVNAVADTLRDDAFTTAFIWVPDSDTVTARFLGSAGWSPDGARRELDMGAAFTMSRLHTAL
ncbi:MAG TPA: GNAT family N-acetyltransferase [Streptosporangiaceae bacterium]